MFALVEVESATIRPYAPGGAIKTVALSFSPSTRMESMFLKAETAVVGAAGFSLIVSPLLQNLFFLPT